MVHPPPPDRHHDSFIFEVKNLLREMNDSLHRLRVEPENQDLLRQICRAFRTITALGRILHYEDLAHYARAFRQVMERALCKEVTITHELVTLCQVSCTLFDFRLTVPGAADLRGNKSARHILAEIDDWSS
ncbi:MAG: hypothetical protein JXQ27_14635 [Acidobacteria bacterium]|nr:hypothetical protein [Acidobacteriota bacterium]